MIAGFPYLTYQSNNTIFFFNHVWIKKLLQVNYTISLFNVSVNNFVGCNEIA